MADRTRIAWTDATWNPVTGCTPISAGCANCYARRMSRRLRYAGVDRYRHEFKPTFHQRALGEPLKWRKPRRVFVCSMGDLFHEGIETRYIAAIFATMNNCPRHTFQLLTKRPERYKEIQGELIDLDHPPANIWLGTSCEDQVAFDVRTEDLYGCPAAVRWVSLEPLLGPIDLADAIGWLNWVVVGGETGPGARPCHVRCVREIVEQCAAAGVPCFVKQLGAYAVLDARYERGLPGSRRLRDRRGADPEEWPDDLVVRQFPGDAP